MGQFDKAFDYMDRSIALNPSSSGHWMDAANTLVLLRKYTQAEEYYKTAISLNPSGSVFYESLAKHYIRIVLVIDIFLFNIFQIVSQTNFSRNETHPI